MKRSYNLDIFKVDQILDILLKGQQLVLSEGHKIPSLEQIKGRKYCKFHGDFDHSTNNCVVSGMSFKRESKRDVLFSKARIKSLDENRD